MAVTHQRVTASTTAVALNSANANGMTLVVRNSDPTNGADVGSSTVTAGTGYRLTAGSTFTIAVPPSSQLFAIRSGAADVVLDIMRFGG